MLSVLTIGFIIGMYHAFEADHVAAVASIVSRRSRFREFVKHGISWGLGHTLTLLIVVGVIKMLGRTIEDELAIFFELAVGIMLITLGGNLIFRLWQNRVHFHVHHHSDGQNHIHFHRHEGVSEKHELAAHDHVHSKGLAFRPLLVGAMQGLAGSAAILVLTATNVGQASFGFLYVVNFGLGSIAGMAVLSGAIAIPLCYTATSLKWANPVLQFAFGIVTIGIGISVIFQNYESLMSTT